MTLYDAFDWLELTAVGVAIRDSAWLFPVIESVHLLGLAALGGAVLVVDLRLLGFGLNRRPTAYELQQASPWLSGAIALMFVTGVPLFLSESLKCYSRPAFWVKMAALVLALIFTFGVRNRWVLGRPTLSPLQARGIGVCSLTLWFTVAAAGRWIGFS
jgi:hypothetical protein